MPHIRVIAARSRTPAGALIRLSQGWRAWSHTADVLTAGAGEQTVEALASRGGVVLSSVESLQARSSAMITLAREVSADVAAARDVWLESQLGARYDWTGAVLAGWAQWREWDDPTAWWCSELTAAAAEHVQLLHVSPYIRGVMPTQCVDLLLASGWYVVGEQN